MRSPRSRAGRPAPETSGRRRRAVVVSTVGALSLTALVPSAAALGAAAPAGPVVTLVAATNTVTLNHFPDEPVFIGDIGVYGVTGGAAFEVRTKRKDYSTQPTSDLILQVKGQRTVTRLPAGLVDGFTGLTGFATQTVKDAKGKTVSTSEQTWCPAGFSASRMQPDAKAVSPYADGCFGSPWSLGAVTGLPAHWASSVGGDFFGFDPSQPIPDTLPDGTYTVTTSISVPWRKVLAATKATSSVTVKVVVKEVPFPDGFEGGAAGAAAASALRAGSGGPSAAAGTKRQFPKQVPAALLGRADGLLPRRSSAAGATGSSGFAGPGAASVPVPAAAAVSPLAASSGAMDRANATQVPKGHRPDLRALPAFGASIIGDFEDPLSTREYLAFAATVWNAGPAPLVVDGYRKPGAPLMDAYQFFYDSKGKQVGWTGTGSLKYDPRSGHEHWHFLDFAKYELVTSSGKAILSQKESFCLAPTDAVDLTVKGARYKPNSTGLSTACGSQQSIAIRETLDAGWGDTYGQFLPGQSFDITDLPNGTYTIRVTANPAGNLVEGSTANNVSNRTVVLGGKKGARTVTVPPVGLIDVP